MYNQDEHKIFIKVRRFIFSSAIRFLISVVLIYLVTTKVGIKNIATGLLNVPLALLVFTVFYSFITCFFSSWRWGIILFKKPSIREISFLIKCNYVSMFYALFMPSSLSGDLVKWIPLVKKYEGISTARIAGSVVIDRIVGASAFFPVALAAALLGKVLKYSFPDYIIWISSAGCLLITIFYVILYYGKVPLILRNNSLFNNIYRRTAILKTESKNISLKIFLISFIVQIAGIFAVWARSYYLGAGFSLLSVYIFIPIISLVLMLPISIAGLGVKEQLYLFFFEQSGALADKILLVSSFSYIVNILIALIGGAMLLPNLLNNFWRPRTRSQSK
jgi:hypothetical protein